jgi:hypothetical protein
VLAVWAQKEFAIQFICLLFAGHWLLTAAGELLTIGRGRHLIALSGILPTAPQTMKTAG